MILKNIENSYYEDEGGNKIEKLWIVVDGDCKEMVWKDYGKINSSNYREINPNSEEWILPLQDRTITETGKVIELYDKGKLTNKIGIALNENEVKYLKNNTWR